MKNNTTLSVTTAERLKELRQDKGLSHEKLSAELSNLYGISISKSSLINYEATDYSSKSGANAGMNIGYLRCLADFYGVSADYILGISNKKTPDVNIQASMECTGLSQETIETLRKIKNRRVPDGAEKYKNALKEAVKMIDILVDDVANKNDGFPPVLNLISEFYSSQNVSATSQLNIDGTVTPYSPDFNPDFNMGVPLGGEALEDMYMIWINRALKKLKSRHGATNI